jgi:hypothetical protein
MATSFLNKEYPMRKKLSTEGIFTLTVHAPNGILLSVGWLNKANSDPQGVLQQEGGTFEPG